MCLCVKGLGVGGLFRENFGILMSHMCHGQDVGRRVVPYRLSHGVLTWTFDPGCEVNLSISNRVPLPLPGFLYLDGFDCGLDECLTCCLGLPCWLLPFPGER
jgi:hypothetical protein